MVCAAGDLVVARAHPRGREVTVLRHGQLISVTIVPADFAVRPDKRRKRSQEVT